ncbi:MAG: zinc ribbon domain-containing protein [Pseudomonadota bacterium]
MGILKHLFGNLLGGKAGHHGNYSSGHHGGGHGHHGYPSYPPSGTPTAAGAQCPSCGALTAAAARFCQQCGTALVAAACATCGASMPPGAKFCGSCGRPRTGSEGTKA